MSGYFVRTELAVVKRRGSLMARTSRSQSYGS